MNLETANECARVCRDWRARQGVTTQWACAHKAEQRSLARQARCNRAHSAVTQNVIVIEDGKVNIHAAFLMFASGQLRFLGLTIAPKTTRSSWPTKPGTHVLRPALPLNALNEASSWRLWTQELQGAITFDARAEWSWKFSETTPFQRQQETTHV